MIILSYILTFYDTCISPTIDTHVSFYNTLWETATPTHASRRIDLCFTPATLHVS